MAIKMDGKIITSLLLKASDGTQVTKTLSESGVINTPTATKEITENGEVDVLNFAKAIVNVASSGGGAEPITGTATITNVNTQKYVTFADESIGSYIATWEYSKKDEWLENTTDTSDGAISGMSIYIENGEREYKFVLNERYRPSRGEKNLYAYTSSSYAPPDNSDLPPMDGTKFLWKTIVPLPTGYNIVQDNIIYKVYPVEVR